MLYESNLGRLDLGRGEWSSLLHGPHGPRRPWYLPVKAAMEWLMALLLLGVTLPLIGVLAILVKLTSPGPALYSQTRLGRFGRTYRLHKLRTMQKDCESATGPVWAKDDDPRVTRLGQFLRDTHLDELPQLWDVVRGEMALVGPRPERPEIANRIERAIPRYRHRLAVRPGITGLAQVEFPADRDLEGVRRKLTHDLYYIRHLGAGMDLRITLSTGLKLFAAILAGMGKLLVKSDGALAERELPAVQVLGDKEWQAGAA